MIIIVLILGILISMIPLAFPGAMIIIAMIVWPIVYAIIYYASIGFDSMQHLPWYIADPERATGTLIVIVAVIGLVRGIAGSLAMLAIWVPVFLMPAWLLNLGVAVEHHSGWSGYVLENYNDNCSSFGRYTCEYSPLDGRALPTFVQDASIGSDRIIKVKPYLKSAQDYITNEGQPEKLYTKSTNHKCITVTEESEGNKTVTTTCYY